MRGPAPAPALAAAIACCAAAIAGCAPALKETPPLLDLAGGGPPPAGGEVEALLRDAESAFARREAGSVRNAARAYLRAASGSPPRVEGVIGAVRAQVWLADHEADPRDREAAATLAVQAAQWCGRIDPQRPACSYWMGAALGVQARERPSTGLSALPRIEAAFREAAEKEPEMDGGAPDRALALLYLRAPGWPSGPGDRERGLHHARKAVAIDPEHPLNIMALAEALAEGGDTEASRKAWEKAIMLARDLAGRGDPDAPEWAEEAERGLRSRQGRSPDISGESDR